MNNVSDFFLPPDDCYVLPEGRQFKYHTDDYFRMGSSHHVCQDYSRAFPNSVFVSDGCSSSRDTDFGSRIAVLCAAELLGDDDLLTTPQLIHRMKESLPSQLKPEALDATLLAAYIHPNGFVQVKVFGDGVVVIRRRDGSVLVIDINQKGAPAYPSYWGDEDRMKTYKDSGYGDYEAILTIDGVLAGVTGHNIEAFPAYKFMVNPMDVDLVVLMSDGAKSFQDVSGLSPKEVPLSQVLPHLIGFKNLTGAFVGRRLNAFLILPWLPFT